MKTIKYLVMTMLGVFALAVSCSDDKELIPVWETAPNAYATKTDGTSANFVYQDASRSVGVDFRWISVDGKTTVTKVDFFLTFTEPYTDTDGNPAVANHGEFNFKSIEGSEIPGNREVTNFSLTQADVYALYSTATFDYGTGSVSVFNNPDKPDRTATDRFVAGDSFTVRWELTTDDGRVFDAWSPSVCTEFPGSNCQYTWGVICESDLAGTYDVVSTFVSPGYFDSTNPDFQYGPGNDGSVAGGVQTYTGVVVEAGPNAASYIIPDITNGFEPIMWGNNPVETLISDNCSKIVFSEKLDGPSYAYTILPTSVVNPDGSFVINWINFYGEYGTSTFTPQ
ncbi:MAG: hypothetical protein ABJH04_16460 [Cyclobacteriaceae bacterium]